MGISSPLHTKNFRDFPQPRNSRSIHPVISKAANFNQNTPKMPSQRKRPVNAPVAKRPNLPTISEIPVPTYDLLIHSTFFESPRDYVTCVLKLHTRPVHLVCMPRKHNGRNIVLTDIVGAHFTRLIEHQKSRDPGKLRDRSVEALDLAVVAELRHRKRKDWFEECKKTLDGEEPGWRLVEALDVTDLAKLPNRKIFEPRW